MNGESRARIEHFLRASWKIWILAYIRARLNQSGACSSSDVITSGGRKSETTMEDKLIVVVCVYTRSFMILLRIFIKTGINIIKSIFIKTVPDPNGLSCRIICCNPTETQQRVLCPCLAEAPPMTRIRVCVVNFTREWREFLAQMKWVNSKLSSVHLRAKSAIYSRLVWTHLEANGTCRIPRRNHFPDSYTLLNSQNSINICIFLCNSSFLNEARFSYLSCQGVKFYLLARSC